MIQQEASSSRVPRVRILLGNHRICTIGTTHVLCLVLSQCLERVSPTIFSSLNKTSDYGGECTGVGVRMCIVL